MALVRQNAIPLARHPTIMLGSDMALPAPNQTETSNPEYYTKFIIWYDNNLPSNLPSFIISFDWFGYEENKIYWCVDESGELTFH